MGIFLAIFHVIVHLLGWVFLIMLLGCAVFATHNGENLWVWMFYEVKDRIFPPKWDNDEGRFTE